MKTILISTGVVSLLFVGAFLFFQNSKESLQGGEAPKQVQDSSLVQGGEGSGGEEINPKEEVVRIVIKTDRGDISLELYPKVAPKTVDNFVKLAKSGFYYQTKFHRVVAGFVIQGGDPLSKTDDPRVGAGGPGYTFEDEINPRSLGLSDNEIAQLEAQGYIYDYTLESMPMDVGAFAMANSGPDTNGSQFFIVTHNPQLYLNGKHTVFGKVVEGMDVARAVEQGDVINGIVIE